MKRVFLLYILLVCYFFSFSQTTVIDTVYSKNVNDNFIITIRKPPGYSASNSYYYVYMTDGSLGIGDYVLGRDKSWAATIPATCVIIAISHIGNWHEKRARDFIPADITKNIEDNFGKASSYYLFLKNELIPKIEQTIKNKKGRVFVGHSFGGLFCLYTLFQKDKLFDLHFAISPSVWANYYELDKIEKAYFNLNKSLKAKLTIYVGGLEFLNKVLFSTRNFYSVTASRKYTGYSITKIEIGNANHFSIRKPAIDRIFDILRE